MTIWPVFVFFSIVAWLFYYHVKSLLLAEILISTVLRKHGANNSITLPLRKLLDEGWSFWLLLQENVFPWRDAFFALIPYSAFTSSFSATLLFLHLFSVSFHSGLFIHLASLLFSPPVALVLSLKFTLYSMKRSCPSLQVLVPKRPYHCLDRSVNVHMCVKDKERQQSVHEWVTACACVGWMSLQIRN